MVIVLKPILLSKAHCFYLMLNFLLEYFPKDVKPWKFHCMFTFEMKLSRDWGGAEIGQYQLYQIFSSNFPYPEYSVSNLFNPKQKKSTQVFSRRIQWIFLVLEILSLFVFMCFTIGIFIILPKCIHVHAMLFFYTIVFASNLVVCITSRHQWNVYEIAAFEIQT